jgi:hypothetical protein
MLLILDPGSGFRDPGPGMDKNQHPGSGINIPDPQHWIFSQFFVADEIKTSASYKIC